jgi:hypothetical protein
VPSIRRPRCCGRACCRTAIFCSDLLYIPRGWWHVAAPLDEPTLHLTVGVNNPTGVDFLSWFVDRLRASEVVRRDVPHLAGPQAEAAFAEQLRGAFLAEWRPDLIGQYIADRDARSRPRPQFALPWTATPEIVPRASFAVRWASSRITPVCLNGEVTVAANGRRWRFTPAAAPILEVLVSGKPCSIDELEAASAVDPQTTREFVKELVENGLVIVC